MSGSAYVSALLRGDGIGPFIIETAIENLSLLPSTPGVWELDVVQELQIDPRQRLRPRLLEVGSEFQYLLVDCPPSLAGLPAVALSVSDTVLIPVQCEYYAMEGLSQILPVIQKIKKSTNPGLEVEGLLLTMFSEELELSHSVVEEVSSFFPELVFDTIIPRDVTLAEAASHGCPSWRYAPAARGTWAYVELAREVMGNG
jgi:chromosome partitioning protein